MNSGFPQSGKQLVRAAELLTAIALAIVIGLSGSLPAAAEEGAPSALERQGFALAERMCTPCHAVGKAGASPHAAAPAFRDLSRRVDLDGFAYRLFPPPAAIPTCRPFVLPERMPVP